MQSRRVGAAVAALTFILVGCSSGGSPPADSPPTNAVSITSATQLADAVGCAGYKPTAPAGFTEGGDCTVGGVAVHLYVFASDSDRNAFVNGILKTSGKVTYAIGETYVIASLDEATIKIAAGTIGATVQ
jgi:hypothetical protein